MKYSTNRKYRDLGEEIEIIETKITKKKRPILLNKKKTFLQKVVDLFKK